MTSTLSYIPSDASNTPTSTATSTSTSGPLTAFSWLAAWGVLLLILWMLSKTELGYTAIYYTLLLTIFFLIVTNAQQIAGVLSPFTNQQSLNGPPTAQTAASGGGGTAGSF